MDFNGNRKAEAAVVTANRRHPVVTAQTVSIAVVADGICDRDIVSWTKVVKPARRIHGAHIGVGVTNWSAPPAWLRLVASIFQSAKSLSSTGARTQERRLRRRAKTRHGVIR
jgi:hypothetical protein